MSVKNIVVNATALTQSGALTILKQFIHHASSYNNYHFYCFIDESVTFKKNDNITLIKVNMKSWLRRIYWDWIGLKKHLVNNKILCDSVVSLQNTSVNIDASQIIYLHQPLPFSNIKWSVFNKIERPFFFYKNLYHIFIFIFVKRDTRFVVQTEWMKNALVNDFAVNSSLIEVIQPDIILPEIKKQDLISNSHYTLLYPATPLFYKNHLIILDALKLIKHRESINNLRFQVTFSPGQYELFDKKAKENNVEELIEYLGILPYEDLIEKYCASDLVVFPSYVETFGLPLAEAASLSKNIVCSDLPFSRDVLKGYSGARYVTYDDSEAWANEIINKYKSNEKEPNFKFVQKSSWSDFFKLLN